MAGRYNEWMKQHKCLVFVCRFADEILAFIFFFKREESMAMPAEHEVPLPWQLSPSFLKSFLSWILGRCNYCAVNL